jgi:hypothetical protein
VRPGVFLSTDGDRVESRAGGGYLLFPDRTIKVVSGALRSMSASTDGCRVAFVYATSSDAISGGYRDWKAGKPGNTLRMVDVCEGGNK